MSHTVLATYDTIDQAHAAVNDLRAAGFSQGQVGFAVNDSAGSYGHYLDVDNDGNIEAEDGVEIGAVMGTLTGALAGLVAITVPGIGPIIGGGVLAALGGAAAGAGIGAATGAVTGGVSAWLMEELGVAEEDAHYYAETLRRGGALVSVTTKSEAETERAEAILEKHHPIDVDDRITGWRSEGWNSFDPDVDPYTAEQVSSYRNRFNDAPYRRDDYDYPTAPVRRYNYDR